MQSALCTLRSKRARRRAVVSPPQHLVLAHGLRPPLCDALTQGRRGEGQGGKEAVWLPQCGEQEESPGFGVGDTERHSLNVCVPPSPYVEILMPSVMVLVGGDFGRRRNH